MALKSSIDHFNSKGYSILDVEDRNSIDMIKTYLADFFRDKFDMCGTDDYILNYAHNFDNNLDDVMANNLVMELIQYFKKKYKMDQVVYDSIKSFIDYFLGQDIASQKNPNIVFQYPYSNRFSELHTDAPNNSKFELVCWLPLVNCYETKSFFILEQSKSQELLDLYRSDSYASWNDFKEDCVRNAIHLTINYGQVLIFWSGLLHGSLINTTSESRFSLNTRFKQLYAPSGLKNPFVFYNVFKSSSISRFAQGF